MNLPLWPGASEAYSKAHRIMEAMAARGHVSRLNGIRSKAKGPIQVFVSDELRAYQDALNKGDEERIKGFNLQYMHFLQP